MKNKVNIIYVTLLLLFSLNAYSAKVQWQKWQFGGVVASLTYYGDLSDGVVNPNLTDPLAIFAADPNQFIDDKRRNIDEKTGVDDTYLYVSAGLSFHVGTKRKAKFQTPVFYPKNTAPNQKEEIDDQKLKTKNISSDDKEKIHQDIELNKKVENSKPNIKVYIFNFDGKENKVIVTNDTVIIENDKKAVAIQSDTVISKLNIGSKDTLYVPITRPDSVELDAELFLHAKDSLIQLDQISNPLKTDTFQIDTGNLKKSIDDLYAEREKDEIDSLLSIEKLKFDTIPIDLKLGMVNIEKDDTLKTMFIELQELKKRLKEEAGESSFSNPNPIDSVQTLFVPDSLYIQKIDSLQQELKDKDDELNTRISDIDILFKNLQDSIAHSHKLVHDTIHQKLEINFDTIKSQSEKIEYLKQKLENLEHQALIKNDTISKKDTIYQKVENSTVIMSDLVPDVEQSNFQTIDSNLYKQQNELISELRKRLEDLEGIQSVKDTLTRKLEKISTEKTGYRTPETSETDDTQTFDLEARIAELEENVSKRMWTEDSIKIVAKYIAENVRKTSENTNNELQQKLVQDKLRSIETQLILLQADKKGAPEEKRLLEEQTKMSKMMQALLLQNILTNSTKQKPVTSHNTKSTPKVNSIDKNEKLKENVQAVQGDSTVNKTRLEEDTILQTKKMLTTDSILTLENEALKGQIQSVQNKQDSLMALLKQLVERNLADEKAKQEQEQSALAANEQRIAGMSAILNQPSIKVFFAVGKSELAKQYMNSLDKIADQLKNYPELKIKLKGFADPTGNMASNLKLSEKRADAVKSYFTGTHRIASDRMTVLPIGQEDGSTNLSYSRRVEVTIVK
ncbi:MAG: OmpA family protein [Chitinophagales bacterium]|nr:OmpA family protein [Chitinophagales bacterium]